MNYLSRKNLIIVAFIGMIYLTKSQTFAQCHEGYCWQNNEEMLIQAELKFVDDMYKGKHAPQKESDANECEYHISSIAYGFAVIESGVGKGKMAQNTNNRYSVKKGSGKYRYNRKEEYGFLAGSNYLKYPDIMGSTLDFMYLIKYGYGCSLSRPNVYRYKMGAYVDDENSARYYRNLLSSIEKFEKKYFGNGQQISDYQSINPDIYKTEIIQDIFTGDNNVFSGDNLIKVAGKISEIGKAKVEKIITSIKTENKQDKTHASAPTKVTKTDYNTANTNENKKETEKIQQLTQNSSVQSKSENTKITQPLQTPNQLITKANNYDKLNKFSQPINTLEKYTLIE